MLSPEEMGAASRRLLAALSPETLWAICSFGPNNEIGPAHTFDPSEELDALRFIERLQGRLEHLLSVNAVKREAH